MQYFHKLQTPLAKKQGRQAINFSHVSETTRQWL